MSKEKVKLKSKKGTFQVDIKTAELRLRAKKVNPTQTWELDDNGYTFDGTNIVKKKPEPKEDKEARSKAE